MSRYQKRSTLSLVVLLIIVAIVIAGIFTAIRAIVFPDGSSKTQIDTSRQELLNTASNHSVSMYVRGPIVGNSQHGSYSIIISPTVNSLTTYVGYTSQVLNSVTVANNQSAYEQFVYALDRDNYANGRQFEGDENKTEGICSSGSVYYFSINVDGEPVKTLWTTSCGGRSSLVAEFKKIKSLFHNQFTPSQLSLIKQVNV